jgi:hypothetical protein
LGLKFISWNISEKQMYNLFIYNTLRVLEFVNLTPLSKLLYYGWEIRNTRGRGERTCRQVATDTLYLDMDGNRAYNFSSERYCLYRYLLTRLQYDDGHNVHITS